MTRKDYKIIAEVIKNSFDEPYSENEIAMIKRMANALQEDNKHFSYTIFFKACGYDDSELKGESEPLKCIHEGCEALQTADGEYCEVHELIARDLEN